MTLTASLSPLGRDMLDLETHFTLPTDGRKQNAIREFFGMTETRYFQLLLDLIDRPEALAYAPVTVNRLQRQVAAAKRRRQMREGALNRRITR